MSLSGSGLQRGRASDDVVTVRKSGQIPRVAAQALGYLTGSAVVAVTALAVQGWGVFCASVFSSVIAGVVSWRYNLRIASPRTDDIPAIRGRARAFLLTSLFLVGFFAVNYAAVLYLANHVNSTFWYTAAAVAVFIGALSAGVGARLLALTKRANAGAASPI